MVVLLLILSVVSFVIIQLPPGDFLSAMIQRLQALGMQVDVDDIRALEEHYGLNLPVYSQYFKWMCNLISYLLSLTMTISFLTLIFTYLVAVPIGIFSATHQYSIGDYLFTGIGFIGLATPNFLLALILMFLVLRYLGWSVGGLFSREYQLAAWSFGKVVDLMKHLPIPLIVVGTAGTAGLIRVLRGSLLDELRKQYVITARAKGLSERHLLFMYLAGSMVMLLSALAMLGTLISDLLLVIVDPRIRFEARGRS
jgi:peptide/nickel transport system permease protein